MEDNLIAFLCVLFFSLYLVYKLWVIESYANTSVDERKFFGVLKLRIGLEIGACTGNAQRVTLWDALRLANTDPETPGSNTECNQCKHNIGDINCTKSCWTRLPKPKASTKDMTELELRQTVVDAILAIQHTGINQKGNLEAHWPFVDVPLNHHTTSTRSNRWFNIIQDTTRAATFAVLSQRCLEFRCSGMDGICSKLVPVPNTVSQSKQTFLSVKVLPQTESRSGFGFLRAQQNFRTKLLICSLGNVSLGGLFRVWKIPMLLLREPQGNVRPAIASTSTNSWSLVSSRPDFHEFITPELAQVGLRRLYLL